MNSASPAEEEAGREPLELVHHHPGRLRLRAEALRADEAGERVKAALLALPGITAIAHKTRTGSVLIEYQPGLVDVEELVARVAEAAGLALPLDEHDPRAKRSSPALVAIGAARELNAVVHELTGYRAELRTLVPAAMAAAAAYSFATKKEDRLPRWDNLLYWSYNIFTQLHRREIDDTEPPRKPQK